MKSLLLSFFLLFVGLMQSYAGGDAPSMVQNHYRWRNDNGNETAATWKAGVDTAITLSSQNDVVRLRLDLSNTGTAAGNITQTLEYSSDNGTNWTVIDTQASKAFMYKTSTFVTNGAATTSQMATATAGTFVAGLIVTAPGAAQSLTNGNKTEYEWVIQATANALPGTTYTFKCSELSVTPTVYGTLKTFGSSPCSGAPTAGSINAATKTVACNSTTTLTLSGNTTGTGINYQWQYDSSSTWVNFGTNTASQTTPPILKDIQFRCMVTCTNAGGSSTNTAPVMVSVLPMAVNIGRDTTLCPEASYTLNTGISGATYTWNTGATTATLNVSTTGTYSVLVTAANGCAGKDTINISLGKVPVNALPASINLCEGSTVTLDAGNSGSTYSWSPGNASTRTISVTDGGNYSVQVKSTDGCSINSSAVVNKRSKPMVNLGNDTFICDNTTYTLDARNAGASYLWNNSTIGRTLTVQATGTYSVQVTDAFNCITKDTATITFLPLPIVDLGKDVAICASTQVILDAGNPGSQYLWDDNSSAQTRTVSTSGTYTVTVSNAAANCKASGSVEATVYPNPIVNLGEDSTFCHGNTLVLDAKNPGATYFWNDSSTAQTLSVSTTGKYKVTVTDAYSCSGYDSININVTGPPTGNINAVYGDDATYTFNVLNAPFVREFVWDFGDGSPTETGALVQHQYRSKGIFTVTVQLKGMCNDSFGDSKTIDVFDGASDIAALEESKSLVLYPNPSRDILFIENKNNLKLSRISVYNLLGYILSDTPADDKVKHTLRTADLAAGVYHLRIETDKGLIIRKFTVLR